MAYDFNGTTQYVSGTSSPLGNRPTAYTMSCWVKAPAQLNSFVFALSNSTNNNYAIAIGCGGVNGTTNSAQVRFFARSEDPTVGAGNINLGGGTAFDNTFHHIAISWDNSTGRLYVDGAEVVSGGSMGTLQDLNRIGIGAFVRASIALHFDGEIAECGMWSATLTQPEIASLAKGMTCNLVRPQSLAFYAPLMRNLQDVKGGLTLTNNNTATVANHPRVYR